MIGGGDDIAPTLYGGELRLGVRLDPARDELESGVLRGAFDVAQARDSLAEAMEIADVIVPGHDNICLNPTRRPM